MSYILTAEEVEYKVVECNSLFKSDPKVPGEVVLTKDYNCSGFDGEHLTPVEDMIFSEEAMNNSFPMSNIFPQRPGLIEASGNAW